MIKTTTYEHEHHILRSTESLILETAKVDKQLINNVDHIKDKEIRLKVLRLMAKRQNLMNGISGNIQCIKEDMIDLHNRQNPD